MSDSAHTWEGAVLWLRSQPDQADLVRACFYDDPLLDAARRYHRSIEWAAVGLAFAQIVMFLGGLVALFGVVMFTRRELAATSAHS